MKVGKHRPGRRQLDRVEVRASRFEECLEAVGGQVEAVPLPALPGFMAQLFRAGGESFDGPGLGGGNIFQARGGDHEHALAGVKVRSVEGRVFGIVKAHHQRPDASLHHGAHAFEPGANVGKRVAPAGG